MSPQAFRKVLGTDFAVGFCFKKYEQISRPFAKHSNKVKGLPIVGWFRESTRTADKTGAIFAGLLQCEGKPSVILGRNTLETQNESLCTLERYKDIW